MVAVEKYHLRISIEALTSSLELRRFAGMTITLLSPVQNKSWQETLKCNVLVNLVSQRHSSKTGGMGEGDNISQCFYHEKPRQSRLISRKGHQL